MQIDNPTVLTGSKIANWTDLLIAYEGMEHFLNTSGYAIDLGSFATGGAVANLSVAGYLGVVSCSTGTTASTSQRSGFISQTQQINLDATGVKRYAVKMRLNTATQFDGTLTGFIACGFIASASAASNDGAYFSQIDNGNMGAVTANNGTRTTVDLGFRLVQNAWHTYEVKFNSAGTHAFFYYDNAQVADITTNLPGAGRNFGYGFQVVRTVATGTNVAIDCDMVYLKLEATSSPVYIPQ